MGLKIRNWLVDDFITCGRRVAIGLDGFSWTTTVDMAAPVKASIRDMTYSPPLLPDYLSKTHDLRVIVGVPTDDEVKAIHDTIRAVSSVSNFPALYDHKLSTQLAQYLFAVQMAVYRNDYPTSLFPVENTYTPPSVPSHIPITLEPVVGAPSDEELESAHRVARALENLANSPFFDSTLSVKLSQHLFNIQFARYIQESNQGHFTRTHKNPLPQKHENNPPINVSHLSPDTMGQQEPRDEKPTEPGSNRPIASQVALVGDMGPEPTSTRLSEKTNNLCVAHAGPQLEEIHEQLKVIGRTLLGTYSVVHRWNGCGDSYRTMNGKGELPWMQHLPYIYSSSSSSLSSPITDKDLVDYLKFYGVGTNLIEEGASTLKPDKKEDAQRLLASYLIHGYLPAS
ncbi:unnamed protein product [Rhizoctonia solani]|uniref:Uncharacterized protein n=1 Tax=Rhizoctonia solani TaxID=456999 RepID=A0A8H3AMU9_9AGAM|nr:unnamed protein product [Rhizoctonia solani]